MGGERMEAVREKVKMHGGKEEKMREIAAVEGRRNAKEINIVGVS